MGILLVVLVATELPRELLTALEIGEESDGKKEGCLRCDSWISASRPSKAAGRKDGSLDKDDIVLDLR